MRRRVRTVLLGSYGLVMLGGLVVLKYSPLGDLSPIVFLAAVIVGVILTFFLGPERPRAESEGKRVH